MLSLLPSSILYLLKSVQKLVQRVGCSLGRVHISIIKTDLLVDEGTAHVKYSVNYSNCCHESSKYTYSKSYKHLVQRMKRLTNYLNLHFCPTLALKRFVSTWIGSNTVLQSSFAVSELNGFGSSC